MTSRRFLKMAFALTVLPSAVGCASNVPGSRPSDMSASQHQSMGAVEEQAAGEHARQYDPTAATEVKDCTAYLGSCWGSNPTDAHNKAAEEHGRAAAAHRAAAQALGAAEERSCRGVSAADRDTSPFLHREAIVEAKPLTRLEGTGAGIGEPQVEEQAGATIVLRPATGLTAERLQLVVECHIARNAVLGNDLTEMPLCPLVPKGVSATVTSVGNGFAVNIVAPDAATAKEILRRAKLL